MFDKLFAPFPPERVSWRVGAVNQDKTRGMPLAYIDARDVMDRLDAVCGPDGWQNKYSHADGKTVCEIGLRINNEWIWKADGAGDSDYEAEKGALSDAFKRAAVRWGIGRYLYDIKAPWVNVEVHGKSATIKDGEHKRLEALLRGKTMPAPETTRESFTSDFQKLSGGIDLIVNAGTLEDLRLFIVNNSATIKALPDQEYASLMDMKDAAKLKLSKKEAA